MKQKDFLLIGVVVFISGIMSFMLSKYLFGAPDNRQEKVEIVEPITAEFSTLSDKYFNKNSIDPTQVIRIGENNNNQPFNKQ